MDQRGFLNLEVEEIKDQPIDEFETGIGDRFTPSTDNGNSQLEDIKDDEA